MCFGCTKYKYIPISTSSLEYLSAKLVYFSKNIFDSRANPINSAILTVKYE